MVTLDSELYEQAVAAATDEGIDPEELVERAVARMLAWRALGRLQSSSPWADSTEDELMETVVAEQRAARAERRRPSL